jgi:hypothetical protein
LKAVKPQEEQQYATLTATPFGLFINSLLVLGIILVELSNGLMTVPPPSQTGIDLFHNLSFSPLLPHVRLLLP